MVSVSDLVLEFQVQEAAAAKAAAAVATLSARRPAPPKNGVDFQNACKLVAANPKVGASAAFEKKGIIRQVYLMRLQIIQNPRILH